jgi:hypothetical protein
MSWLSPKPPVGTETPPETINCTGRVDAICAEAVEVTSKRAAATARDERIGVLQQEDRAGREASLS